MQVTCFGGDVVSGVFRCTCAARAARGRAVRTPRAADMDLRLTRPRKRAAAAGAGASAVFTCGCRRRVQRAGDRLLGGAGAGRARAAGGGASARRPPVRLGAASARSSPDPAVRRAGVSPRAPGGGGEPRAARPRADAAAGRSRSAPHPPRAPAAGRRRARSLACRDPAERAPPPAHPAPRLRPVFLWARQRDGTVQEVRCEDYDPRNRIRIARTPTGWRVIPRTEIFDSILVTSAPARDIPAPSSPHERRRRRRPGRPRRRHVDAAALAPGWLAPDLESHIPSHTIAVPRAPPAPPEPTPLDNLLAVAELEFNQQRGEEALELELQTGTSQYPFLPEAEEVARNVMSFELGEPKPPDEMFFDQRKTHAPERATEEDAFQSDMGVHKDLFDTISEAHYLPELGGPHDEALLESLVEKGCEDNQILGQALDKLAHLVHGSGDYAEEEDDILLGGAPVADIIDRLEQSLESPSRSSMTAAQGLLHLHNIGDHLPPPDHQQTVEQTYMTDEVFASADAPNQCALDTLNAAAEMQEANEVNHLEYDQSAEKRLQNHVGTTDLMYTEQVPDISVPLEEQHPQPLPDQSEVTLPSELPSHVDDSSDNATDIITPKIETDENGCDDESNTIKEENSNMDFLKDLEETANSVEMVATDLSTRNVKNKASNRVVASAAETTNAMDGQDNLSEKSDDQPRDLSLHRRLPTPHASPRRIDIPRAPSRESDAMQSPQPSGIPAVPSSPEIFTMPLTKSKQSLFLETLLSSPSPKMYTSEVTITKQQCEPLNLGKHRKSASPTVTSCSDEIRKLTKEFGEPQEKRIRRESTDDLVKISKIFNKCDEQITESKLKVEKKLEKSLVKSIDDVSPYTQLQDLKNRTDLTLPEHLFIHKEKLSAILANPGVEIPALIHSTEREFSYPHILQDPNILMISVMEIEKLLLNKKSESPSLAKEAKQSTPKTSSNTSNTEHTTTTTKPDQTSSSSQPKPIPSMDALAGDIDAATSAALNQMLWLPYISQLEAMAACSQNMDFLKALNSSGYNGPNYPDLSQMFNPNSRFMGPSGFPMMPPMDYDNRMQFAMWQEAMNHANQQAQRPKPNECQAKEMPSKSTDVQNPYVHSTKSHHQNKSHSSMSSRTSPMPPNYTASQRAAMQHNPFLQNMYPGMNPNIRPNVPLPGLQIPYFNPNMMGSQRSPRSSQQKSPTSPYYPNNNYLQSVKHSEAQSRQRSSSTGSQESPRPRISVKSLHNLLEPSPPMPASSSRRSSNPPATGRRREEPEVGSTTPLGEPPVLMPPHPHDPSSFHLWHPLFGK